MRLPLLVILICLVASCLAQGQVMNAFPPVPPYGIPQPADRVPGDGIENATIAADANLYLGPNRNTEVLEKLYLGTKVVVIENIGSWTRIRVGGMEGYVESGGLR